MQIGQRKFMFLICTSNLAYKRLIIRTKEHEWGKKKKKKQDKSWVFAHASIHNSISIACIHTHRQNNKNLRNRDPISVNQWETDKSL